MGFFLEINFFISSVIRVLNCQLRRQQVTFSQFSQLAVAILIKENAENESNSCLCF